MILIIGHSCGAGFLIRWLTEHKIKVNKVILIAPWIDPYGTLENSFFKFEIGKHLANRTKKGITVFNSDNDSKYIQDSVKILLKSNPDIFCKEFHNYGHFCLRDMKTREFPELLEEALS